MEEVRTRLEMTINVPNEKIIKCLSKHDMKLPSSYSAKELMKSFGELIKSKTGYSIQGDFCLNGNEKIAKVLCYPIRFPWEYTSQEQENLFKISDLETAVKDFTTTLGDLDCKFELIKGAKPAYLVTPNLRVIAEQKEKVATHLVREISPSTEFLADEDILEMYCNTGFEFATFVKANIRNPKHEIRSNLLVIADKRFVEISPSLAFCSMFPWNYLEFYSLSKAAPSEINIKKSICALLGVQDFEEKQDVEVSFSVLNDNEIIHF